MTFFIVALFSVGVYACYAIYFLFGLIRVRRLQPASNNSPTVSIIVAARNEEELLPVLLSSLSKQDYPKNKLEIIISDDRSTDKTWDCIKTFEEKYSFYSGIKIKEIPKYVSPKKHALTQAILQSSGELILSTDADCVVPKTWVSSIVSCFENDVGIVVGYSEVKKKNASFFTHFQGIDFLALMSANAGTMGWSSPWSGSGQNLAYRKSEFDRIGGFSPVLHQISGDDMYLIQSISKHKRAIFNTSRKGFVTTAPVSTLKMYLNQRIRWASNSQKLMGNNLFFLFFLLSTLICNVFILTSPFSFGGLHLLLILLGIKALFDGLIIYTGSIIFHSPISFVSFIVWFLFQPIYIPLVGVLGLAGAFSWKE